MRQNNISRFYIQHQKNSKKHLRALLIITIFWVIFWCGLASVEWIGQIIHENQMLKVERQIESNQLCVRLTADVAAEKRKEDERKKAIADLCKRDKQGCRIILTRW